MGAASTEGEVEWRRCAEWPDRTISLQQESSLSIESDTCVCAALVWEDHHIVLYHCDDSPMKPFEVKSEPIERPVERMGGGGRWEAREDECDSAVRLAKLESTWHEAPLSPFVVVDLSVVLLCFVWLN